MSKIMPQTIRPFVTQSICLTDFCAYDSVIQFGCRVGVLKNVSSKLCKRDITLSQFWVVHRVVFFGETCRGWLSN